MHFITGEYNEALRCGRDTRIEERPLESFPRLMWDDGHGPSWLLVRTENTANGRRTGGEVKNAPLATRYLHKLSHCALGTGTICCVSVWEEHC